MLSTPPAFILSQDQTLMFNVDPSSRSTSFFILVITVLIKNVRWFLLKSSEKFIRIFKVVLLFSCQRSFCDLLRIISFIIISLCSWFVKSFFDLFCWPALHKNRSNFYIISFSFHSVKSFFDLFYSIVVIVLRPTTQINKCSFHHLSKWYLLLCYKQCNFYKISNFYIHVNTFCQKN